MSIRSPASGALTGLRGALGAGARAGSFGRALLRHAHEASPTKMTVSAPAAFGTRALYRIRRIDPMSTLVLVRHGQARAFDADSDRLTEMGEEQARRVGQYFVQSGVELDEVCVGTLVRQRRTLELVAEAFAQANKPFPSPTVDA